MFLQGKRLIQFEAIQSTLVPTFAGMNQESINRSRTLLNNFLRDKDQSVLFKIAFFLNIIDLISFFFAFHSFNKLSPLQKNRVMFFFFDSPIPLLRKGFWGINTLAKMGVYGQPEIYENIDYKIKKLGSPS